jgi:hypothetical protein
VVEAPSTDHNRARTAIRSQFAEGATATGDAAGRDQPAQAEQGHAPSAIVLLSDGATTSGSDSLGGAGRKQAHIAIDTVALGKPGAVIPTPSGNVDVSPDPKPQADRLDLGRPGVHGLRRQPSELDLQEPRHPARHRTTPQRLVRVRDRGRRCCSARAERLALGGRLP